MTDEQYLKNLLIDCEFRIRYEGTQRQIALAKFEERINEITNLKDSIEKQLESGDSNEETRS